MRCFGLDDGLPKDIKAKLDSYLAPGESVTIAAESDMRLEGTYGTSYVVATNERLLTLDSNHADGFILSDIPLRDIASINMRRFVGNGVLEVGTDNRVIDVARFSGSLALRFKEVQKALARMIEREHGERVQLDSAVEEEAAERQGRSKRYFCPKCGRALARSHGVCMACVERRKVLKRLFGYAKPYWRLIVLGLVFTLLVRSLSLIPIRLTKPLVDDVLPNRNMGLLAWFVLIILSAYGLSALFRSVGYYVNGMVGQKIIYDMRTSIFNHLQALSLSYYDRNQTGRVMTRVITDTGRLQEFVVNTVRQVVGDILEVIMIAFILFSQDWRLTILSLAPVPIVAFGTWLFGRIIRKVYRKVWRRMSSVNAVLADAIGGVQVVKAFAQEGREKNRFASRAQAFMQDTMRTISLRARFFPALTFVSSLGVVLIWWYGGLKVINPSLAGSEEGPGMLVMFIGFLWRFYQPIQRFSDLNHRIQHATTSAERVFEVLDTDPEISDAPDALAPAKLRGKVEFKNVSFSYDGGRPVLNDINLVIHPGEMIGIVGRSGVGKTTLVNLISRFYEVKEGAVLIDDVDVRRIKLQALRNSIGMVLQEPYLFHGSVHHNIAYAKPQASPEEVMAAAKAANAHDFIVGFPEGYDTQVGERGVRLSSGQKQRVSIARAILTNPAILILDEATASVDTETEKQIQEAIGWLVSSRTTFAIAHRLSTLQIADRIIVLDKGKIVEQGTHDELLALRGLYHHLCELQAEISKVRAL